MGNVIEERVDLEGGSGFLGGGGRCIGGGKRER